MIDSEGFRPNVGIIMTNRHAHVFWAKRVGHDAWQFPQGGIRKHENPIQAMYRELREETGLLPEHVELLGCTNGWLRYRIPKHLIRRNSTPRCVGQKQVWFMLRMLGDDQCVALDRSRKPEFERWRWVDYWYPLREVVVFKRRVYEQALNQLAPLLFPGHTVPKLPL